MTTHRLSVSVFQTVRPNPLVKAEINLVGRHEHFKKSMNQKGIDYIRIEYNREYQDSSIRVRLSIFS